VKDIWLTSDTHFSHTNIIKYCSRPFANAEEMNEVLIENWNKVVKPGDLVYHLGDVVMGGTQDEFKKLWPRLTGRKRLVVGNHDDVKFLAGGGFFDKVMLWRVWNDLGLLFSHVPVHQSSIHERVIRQDGMNVHGHTHTNGPPKGPYVCVCTELTNYTPIHIEQLVDLKIQQQKEFYNES